MRGAWRTSPARPCSGAYSIHRGSARASRLRSARHPSAGRRRRASRSSDASSSHVCGFSISARMRARARAGSTRFNAGAPNAGSHSNRRASSRPGRSPAAARVPANRSPRRSLEQVPFARGLHRRECPHEFGGQLRDPRRIGLRRTVRPHLIEALQQCGERLPFRSGLLRGEATGERRRALLENILVYMPSPARSTRAPRGLGCATIAAGGGSGESRAPRMAAGRAVAGPPAQAADSRARIPRSSNTDSCLKRIARAPGREPASVRKAAAKDAR